MLEIGRHLLHLASERVEENSEFTSGPVKIVFAASKSNQPHSTYLVLNDAGLNGHESGNLVISPDKEGGLCWFNTMPPTVFQTDCCCCVLSPRRCQRCLLNKGPLPFSFSVLRLSPVVACAGEVDKG